MKAPPLYRVRSYPLSLLVEHDYDLGEDLATDRKYTIAQQDNLMFRQIRIITGNARRFIPYVIFVDGNSAKTNADAIKHVVSEGIVVGGRRYLFGERSASMTRNCIFSFVDAEIFDELVERITLGVHIDETVLSKYYAYRGLMFSSCWCLDGWHPKIIVVPDCTLTIKNQNIKYLYDKKTVLTNSRGEPFEWVQKDIAEKVVDYDINAFDGCGILHPSLAKEIERITGSDTPVTSFIVRGVYIKGCLHSVDYPQYFAERGVEYIQDMFGRWHNASEPMVILTKSMMKGLPYVSQYKDGRAWDEYLDLLEKYNHCFGVAKANFSFESEPIMTRLNYQVLQTLDVPYDDFKHLADYTKAWAERIVGGDRLYTYAFLGLTASKATALNDYTKAILRNPDMLNERFVRKYLRDSLRKYLDDAKAGKLWADACFKFLVPDLIALLEHIGGLPVKGVLQSDEFFSTNIHGPIVGKRLIERNPHICRSEHALMNGVTSPELEKYFGHLANTCMLNCKSLTAQRLNGCDFDGDLGLVVNNDIMFSGVHPELPIVIDIEDKITGKVEKNTAEGRVALTLRTVQNSIGTYSNVASAYHNKTASSREQKEKYMKYVDITSVVVGKSIDFAKTNVIFKLPHYIEKYGRPLPYFMKYRGKYYAKQKLSKSWSNLNRMCMDLEKWHKKLTWARPPAFDWHIMIDDSIFVPDNVRDAIAEVFAEYNKEVSDTLADQRRIRKYEDDDVVEQIGKYDAENWTADFGEIYERYKRRCAEICPDQKMLANIAVQLAYEKKNYAGKFHWVVAGAGILQNIKQVPIVTLPIRDPFGPYEYLGRKYSMMDVDMTEAQLSEDDDMFAEFNDTWEDSFIYD